LDVPTKSITEEAPLDAVSYPGTFFDETVLSSDASHGVDEFFAFRSITTVK
jgi:hypothetical protein